MTSQMFYAHKEYGGTKVKVENDHFGP